MNSRKYVYIQRTQNHPIDIDFEILKTETYHLL